MTESKTLQSVAAILSDKPVTLTVAVSPSNWIEKQLIRYGLKADRKTYHLQELTPGTMERIGRIWATIPEGSLDSRLEKHILIAAIALQNNGKHPQEEVLDSVKWGVTMPQLDQVIAVVTEQLNASTFLNMITKR